MIIGLDVGGTHTDAVLLNKTGIVKKTKVTTDSSDLFTTVLSALTCILKDSRPEKIERLVLSTTLTTNAVVQKKVDKVGIIVSAGPGIDPQFYRTDEYFYAVSGSMDHRGRERTPVNEKEIRQIGADLKTAGIKSIGIIGKFSPRNPAHELTIESILKNDFEKIFLGHTVSGNLNFPRRIATVHLNAAVFNMHKNFFDAVKKSLKEKGLHIPIQILKADGGTMNLESSMAFPGQAILSGPAASVIGALAYAPEKKDTIVLDIGGTTTDIALLAGKAPLLEPVGIKRGIYKSLIRSLKTRSIGIGGDSRVVIQNKEIKIGPERTGPAMCFGGSDPTPTDALVVLDIIKTENREASLRGIKTLADQLGETVRETAENIFEETCSVILNQAFKMIKQVNSKPVYTVHEFLEGYKIKPQRILLLGGPARDMKDIIEQVSGIDTQVVMNSDVANAIGAALARTTCEVTLSADTEQGIVSAPEENYSETINQSFTNRDAVEKARALLRKKAIQSGSKQENMEMEILENQSFNIVRRFSPRGKIFRIKIQVKPGLIKGYTLQPAKG